MDMTQAAPSALVQRRRLALPDPGSPLWLVAVAVAFTGTQLMFVSLRMGLSWDEVVYVSQTSGHAPAAFFDPARARGVPLLVAPITAATSSIVALRVYLAVLSGLGLLGGLWAWRPLRPAWVLALAGVAFGSLWVALYYGPQAMPDGWVALTALAATGFFLRAATGCGQCGALVGVTLTMALAALLRPGDAVFLAAPLVLAALVVPAWRKWPLLACVLAGTAVGAAEWVAEAYLRFGSPLHRLHLAGQEQGGLGLHVMLWAQLRALNGPTLCRPCTIGWRYPVLSVWWLALPVLVSLGVLAARKAGRAGSSALAAICGLSLVIQYTLLIGYAAPRFLLPTYALLAIPVADLLAFLVNGVRPDLQMITRPVVVVLLAVQILAQFVVLSHEVSGTVVFHNDYRQIAADLAQLGVHPPCVIKGEQFIPIAFYAGCASAPSLAAGLAARQPVAVLAHPGHHPRGLTRDWVRHRLHGTRVLHLVAYLPPGGMR